MMVCESPIVLFLSDSGAEPPPVDCAVSKWSEWSYCSVTCGMGWRERHRVYLDKKAHSRACNKVLKEQDLCYAAQKVCRYVTL